MSAMWAGAQRCVYEGPRSRSTVTPRRSVQLELFFCSFRPWTHRWFPVVYDTIARCKMTGYACYLCAINSISAASKAVVAALSLNSASIASRTSLILTFTITLWKCGVSLCTDCKASRTTEKPTNVSAVYRRDTQSEPGPQAALIEFMDLAKEWDVRPFGWHHTSIPYEWPMTLVERG